MWPGLESVPKLPLLHGINKNLRGSEISEEQISNLNIPGLKLHLFLLADIFTRYMFLRYGKLTVRNFYSIKPLLEQKAMMKLTLHSHHIRNMSQVRFLRIAVSRTVKA